MDGVVEPGVAATRLARAWREAAAEPAGAGQLSRRVGESCALEFARAVLHDITADGGDGPRRVSIAAARLGSARAGRGGSIYELIADLVALERAALDIQLADATTIQSALSCALLAGTAAFTRAAALDERKRIREARHDLMNAVGAVRNAILLMDDEASPDAREHFLAIARRNSLTAQELVRQHLSDSAAVPAWLDCAPEPAERERRMDASKESAAQQRRDFTRAHEGDHRNAELR
jgi:hypothetical protein